MINLELEKKKLELKRVIYMKEELEFKVLERVAEIERIKENIKIQESKMAELEAELKEENI